MDTIKSVIDRQFEFTLSPEEKSKFEENKKRHCRILNKYHIRYGENADFVPTEIIEATQDGPGGSNPDYRKGDKIRVIREEAFLESLTSCGKKRKDPPEYEITLDDLDKYLPDLINKAKQLKIRNNCSNVFMNELGMWWRKFLLAQKHQQESFDNLF